MRILAVIHRGRNRWCYDVLYRLGPIDRLRLWLAEKLLVKFHRICHAECDLPEYESDCPVARRYEERGWIHYCSGDTDHVEAVLRDMGLRDAEDLDGLIQYLSRTFGPDSIVVEDVGGGER